MEIAEIYIFVDFRIKICYFIKDSIIYGELAEWMNET